MPKVRTEAVGLFTPDEDAILAKWFGVKSPQSAKGIDIAEAIERLGFDEEPGGPYSLLDAAVAFIVLERVEEHLPQWASVSEERGALLARKYRDRELIPERKIVLQPRSLFTINWADSGPGFSWPVAYYVTWIPYYDRFVVTASADCPDMFGYCDFALGAFSGDTPANDGAKTIICGDWQQLSDFGQQRWEYLFDTGLVSREEAKAWADEVWPEEEEIEEEEDLEDEDTA